MADKEETFGEYKKSKERTSAITKSKEQPFGAYKKPIDTDNLPQSKEPTITMDEDGELMMPDREWTKEEREIYTLISFFKKYVHQLDERILWYIVVEAQRQTSLFAVAFSPEVGLLTKRVRDLEKRLGIKVQESDKIVPDYALEAGEGGK